MSDQVGSARSTDLTSSSRDLWWLERVLAERIDALDRLHQSQRADDQLALDKALEAQQEIAAKHNDLIRQMERKDATYATKADIDRVTAALALLLPREVFDNTVEQWQQWRATIEKDRSRLSGEKEGSSVTKATMIAYLGAVATALGVLIVAANWLSPG